MRFLDGWTPRTATSLLIHGQTFRSYIRRTLFTIELEHVQIWAPARDPDLRPWLTVYSRIVDRAADDQSIAVARISRIGPGYASNDVQRTRVAASEHLDGCCPKPNGVDDEGVALPVPDMITGKTELYSFWVRPI
jgi:hypothetical protein